MRILGIETSTDETAVTIVQTNDVENPSTTVSILGNALFSQAALHNEYGGVYPNLAKREHSRNLVPILREALGQVKEREGKRKEKREIPKEKVVEIKDILEREPELFVQLAVFLVEEDKPDIDAIAVTNGPGLEPALWVGVNFARALSLAWNVPIVPVNHMEGHIFAALYERSEENFKFQISNFKFPAIALLVSGGHTELLLSKQYGAYELIGRTRDDAAGEAFDKSARLLGLPYPGGPEISRLAHTAREANLPPYHPLPRPMMDADTFDFSFSGLKTAVRNLIHDSGELNVKDRAKIAREIEDAIVDVLVAKTMRAVDEYGAHAHSVSGGVSANSELRRRFREIAVPHADLTLHFPTPDMATDNAIMIALAGSFRFKRGETAKAADLSANGNMSLHGKGRRYEK
jgi:N6-L-threonylcarbamoyladenine synthase